MDKNILEKKKRLKILFCKKNGHNFTKWKLVHDISYEPNPYLGHRDMSHVYQPEFMKVEKDYWERTCTECEYVEKSSTKPAEVELEELEKRIAELKKVLKK